MKSKLLGGLREKLKAKTVQTNWLDRRRMRIFFLTVYGLLAGLILVVLSVSFLESGKGDLFFISPPSNVTMEAEGPYSKNINYTLAFEKDADYYLLFEPVDARINPTVRMIPNYLGLCEATRRFPRENIFQFTILGLNGTAYPAGKFNAPCEVHVTYDSQQTLPPIYVFGTEMRKLRVELKRTALDVPSKFSTLSIEGPIVSSMIDGAIIQKAYVKTIVGSHRFVNVTLLSESYFESSKSNIELSSRVPFVANFSNLQENLCVQSPLPITNHVCEPGFEIDPCAGLNNTVGLNCAPICTRGTVAVGFNASDPLAIAALPAGPPLLHTVIMNIDGGLQLSHRPNTTRLTDYARPWQGFAGPKPINFTEEDITNLRDALHDNTITLDMITMSISGPGTSLGRWYWARREIYLLIPPPIFSVFSAGLLTPVNLDKELALAPGFCPSVNWVPIEIQAVQDAGPVRAAASRRGLAAEVVDGAEVPGDEGLASRMSTTTLLEEDSRDQDGAVAGGSEVLSLQRGGFLAQASDAEAEITADLADRKMEMWRLIRFALDPAEDSFIAIREECLGNFVYSEDPVTGRVKKELAYFLKSPLTLAVIVISLVLSVLLGIGIGMIIKKVYVAQTKKKRAELLLKLRALKAQGYYSLGSGYNIYHSPPDASRWKRDFYIGDPFGRVSAVRSIKDYGGFSDVFRALNGQDYQTLRIQIEDESAVKRARLARREREISASVMITKWFRNTKMQLGLREQVKALQKDLTTKRQQDEQSKRFRNMGHGGVKSKAPSKTVSKKASAADAKEVAERALREKQLEDKAKQQINAAQELRALEEEREASKLQQRARKIEIAEEELLVRYYVGPFLFMSVFLETLVLTFWPGRKQKLDYDKSAISEIKRLMSVPSRQNVAFALSKAFRISDKALRDTAVDHIKKGAGDFSDVVNREVRAYQRKVTGLFTSVGKVLSKVLSPQAMAQLQVVTIHVFALLIPPIVIILFGFGFTTAFEMNRDTAICYPTSFRSYYSFFLGYIFYVIAFIKLGYFYSEVVRGDRLKLRQLFHFVFLLMTVISLILIIIVVFWVLLGLLLNPERVGPYAAAIGTMVTFVTSQYRRIIEMRDKLKAQIEAIINSKFKDFKNKIEDMEMVLDRIVTEMGLSLRNIVVLIFGAAILLAAIFVFIFVGIAVFKGKGGAMALIQSGIAIISGAGLSFLKGKEKVSNESKMNMKVPTIIKDIIESVIDKGIDKVKAQASAIKGAAAGLSALGGANASAAALAAAAAAGGGSGANEKNDIETISTLYGASKSIRESAVLKGVAQLGLVTADDASTSVQKANALDLFWMDNLGDQDEDDE